MKSQLLFALILFSMIIGCKDENPTPSIQLDDSETGGTKIGVAININIEEVFETHNAASRLGGLETDNDALDFLDLVYEIHVLRAIDEDLGLGFVTTARYYFTFDSLGSQETIFLPLEDSTIHVLELLGFYMLDEGKVTEAHNNSLTTRQIDITNSTLSTAIDTTVTVLNYFQNRTNFSIGKYNLSQIFGFSTNFFRASVDTVSFRTSGFSIIGPRIFNVSINNGLNSGLSGTCFLEIDGGNSDPVVFYENEVNGLEFIAYDYLTYLKLGYESPSGIKNYLGEVTYPLQSYDPIYYDFQVAFPELITDGNGELVQNIFTFNEEIELIPTDNLMYQTKLLKVVPIE